MRWRWVAVVVVAAPLVLFPSAASAKQVTKFDSDRIFGYAWSRDAKQFAVIRGNGSAEIILMKDFR